MTQRIGDAEAGVVVSEPEVSTEPDVDEGQTCDGPRSGRRTSIAFAAAVASVAVLGAMWTLSSPIGSSPDDDFHLASIWCSATAPDDACVDHGWSYAAGQTFVDVPAEVGPMWCYTGFGETSAGCLEDWIEHGTFVRSLANDGLYPGLYHTVLGMTVSGEPVVSALLARAASWVWCMALLGASWLLLPRSRRLEFLMVLLVTAVPHGVFLWASTNPSGVVVAAVAAAWCATVALLRAEDRRTRRLATALLVVAVISAAGSRSDGGLYAFVAIAAAGILVWRPGRDAIERLATVAGVGVLGLGTSVVVLSRRLEATGVGGLTSPQIDAPPEGSLWGNLLELPYFITGNLGQAGIGWLDTPMPSIVWVSMLIMFSAVVIRGLGQTDLGKVLALATVLAGLLLLPYYFLWRAGTTVGFEVQPRYVLPLMPVIGCTALFWRRGTSLGGLNVAQVGTIVVLSTVAHSVALHTNLRRYLTGIDVRSPNLDANREWWWDLPFGPNIVWLAGTVAFGTLATMLGGALVRSATPDAPDGSRSRLTEHPARP